MGTCFGRPSDRHYNHRREWGSSYSLNRRGGSRYGDPYYPRDEYVDGYRSRGRSGGGYSGGYSGASSGGYLHERRWGEVPPGYRTDYYDPGYEVPSVVTVYA